MAINIDADITARPKEDRPEPHGPNHLQFPPFARVPLGRFLLPYNQFDHQGLAVPSSSAPFQPRVADIMKNIELVVPIPDGQNTAGRQPRSQIIDKAPPLPIVERKAWLIGKDGSGWEEPEGSSSFNGDLSTPPFDRLMAVVHDFQSSRRPAFEFRRNKVLFDIFRDALGLRRTRGAKHWITLSTNEPDGEDCVLLTRPLDAVRGFLAMARREAEAGWDFQPALTLSLITASFLSFIEYYGVLSDIPANSTAAALARSAPSQLLEAQCLDESISDQYGLNRLAWTVWGGEYGAPERGGQLKEPNNGDNRSADQSMEGGWTVQLAPDQRPEPIGRELATAHLQELVAPFPVAEFALTDYMPFARRRIKSVLSPDPTTALLDTPSFQRTHIQVITEPAPWTIQEKWRMQRGARYETEGVDEEAVGFDRETATFDEPNEIVLWLNPESTPGMDIARLKGMALRGRWACVKFIPNEHDQAWWVFKAKDYIATYPYSTVHLRIHCSSETVTYPMSVSTVNCL